MSATPSLVCASCEIEIQHDDESSFKFDTFATTDTTPVRYVAAFLVSNTIIIVTAGAKIARLAVGLLTTICYLLFGQFLWIWFASVFVQPSIVQCHGNERASEDGN